MGRAENRNKAQARAAYLKIHEPVRTHFACPWGCNAMIKVDGGQSLINHLIRCKGNRRVDNRARTRQTQTRISGSKTYQAA